MINIKIDNCSNIISIYRKVFVSCKVSRILAELRFRVVLILDISFLLVSYCTEVLAKARLTFSQPLNRKED